MIANIETRKKLWVKSIDSYIHNVFLYGTKNGNHNLLADGFDIQTKDPVYWIDKNSRKIPISNFASQQHFLRLLVSMSLVTHKADYKKQAVDIVKYFTRQFTDQKSHLFYWGGHRFINLSTLQLEGPANKSQVHELKNHLPFYDFLYQVDPEGTLKFIKALWNAHINDWHTLDFSRHGDYDKDFDPDVFLHQRKDVIDPLQWPHLPKTVGLTFINAGTDLIYAAYKYAQYTKDEHALSWAKHLYRQYVLARCPLTGLPTYQYSSPLQREPTPVDDNQTESWYGDRAFRQFGPEFGEIAIEANVLFRDMSPMDMWPLLMDNPLAILMSMKQQPDTEVIKWTVDGLKNYYQIAYCSATKTLKPLWGNGLDMTGYVFVRDGYYGKKGTVLNPIEFKIDYLFPLILAWSISRDDELEQLIILILSDFKLIKFNRSFQHLEHTYNDSIIVNSNLVFALIELNLILKNTKIDELILNIAEGIYHQHYHDGFFLESQQHRFVRLDNIYPQALLAAIYYQQDDYSCFPIPISKGGYIHGEYLMQGKLETIYDVNYIYQQLI